MTLSVSNIAFIGFGEAGQAFAAGLLKEDITASFRGYDIKINGPNASVKQVEFADLGVKSVDTCLDACAGADLIFSFVTADQSETVAHTAAQGTLSGALFFDCNSCAPETKRRSAKVIEAAGGRYVDVAVMTPVHPKLHKCQCLLSGPHAEVASDIATRLGMQVEVAGHNIGDASTRKMIRSVMIKGLEALTLECFLAARTAGIEDYIVASLNASFPGFAWEKRAPHMVERMATHGIRRAAEMEEVAKTLRDLGLAPHMSERTVLRQREIGTLGLKITDAQAQDINYLTDTILASMPGNKVTKE